MVSGDLSSGSADSIDFPKVGNAGSVLYYSVLYSKRRSAALSLTFPMEMRCLSTIKPNQDKTHELAKRFL